MQSIQQESIVCAVVVVAVVAVVAAVAVVVDMEETS
jgi:hypothetical protein